MKRRKKSRSELLAQISRIHDKLFDRAQAIISEFNPCKVITKDNKTTCFCYRNRKRDHSADLNTLCCTGCKHHKANVGCIAVRPLSCKLWLCPPCHSKGNKVVNKLSHLEDLAYKAELLDYRSDRKAEIDRAFSYWWFYLNSGA